MSTALMKPDAGVVDSKPRLVLALVKFYDRLVELGRPLMPSQVPVLKASAAATLATLRATVGDAAGEAGPRAVVLTGASSILDGAQALYAWNATDTTADNGTSVIQPAQLAPGVAGRWNRLVSPSFFGTEAASVVAATTLVPGQGKTVPVTGATGVDFIATAGRTPGTELRLDIVAGFTMRHNIAAPPAGSLALYLAGAVNYAAPANSNITFEWSARLGLWREVGRST